MSSTFVARMNLVTVKVILAYTGAFVFFSCGLIRFTRVYANRYTNSSSISVSYTWQFATNSRISSIIFTISFFVIRANNFIVNNEICQHAHCPKFFISIDIYDSNLQRLVELVIIQRSVT